MTFSTEGDILELFRGKVRLGAFRGRSSGRADVILLLVMDMEFVETVTENRSVAVSRDDDFYPDFSQIRGVRLTFIIVYAVEFLAAVVGNLLVGITVYRHQSMHSPVNYYIVNLGVCDFMVGAFVLPVKLFELTAEADMNIMTDVLCTIVRYMETIFVFTSVFTLVTISLERYYAVVHPMSWRIKLTTKRIRRVLCLVWLVPCVVAAPNLYPASARKDYLYSEYGAMTRTMCIDNFSDEFRRGYFIFLFVFMYACPLVFICIACVCIARVLVKEIPAQQRSDQKTLAAEKNRRKVAQMVMVIVLAFVLCWSPYFLVSLVTVLQKDNFFSQHQFFFTMLCINLLAFANSCINPLVYFSMSVRFRKGFQAVFRAVFCCTKPVFLEPKDSISSFRSRCHTVNASGLTSSTNSSCRSSVYRTSVYGTSGRRSPARTLVVFSRSEKLCQPFENHVVHANGS